MPMSDQPSFVALAKARAERRYLNRHPKAKLYVGFGDFAFFRLAVERASLNGGFGKAYHLALSDLVFDGPANNELADAEQPALDHMNRDHRDALDVYARAFAGAEGDGWIMTGIDAEGFDLVRGEDAQRVFFDAPLAGAAALRQTLVGMAVEGRKRLGHIR